MEQHPVPQNITSFQFRLIGDMTIKQFGYLAGGIILAFISYKLPLPFFFTWPMAVVFALTGFGFAFVPVEERPMDVWVTSFLRNVYNPTLFHWEHTEAAPEPPKSLVPPLPKIPTFRPAPARPAPVVQQKTQAPEPTTKKTETPKPQPPKTTLRSPFDSFFVFIDTLFTMKPKSQPAYVVARQTLPAQIPPRPGPFSAGNQYQAKTAQQGTVVPTPSITGKKIEPMPETARPAAPGQSPSVVDPAQQKTEDRINQLKTELEQTKQQLAGKASEDKRFLELQEQLNAFLRERQAMEAELTALRSKIQSNQGEQPQLQRPAGVVQKQPNEPTVKTMSPDVATRAGLPRLTTFPNVVTGIIKDYDNNLLPGVLVTVKDKEGVPLRALKTNKLGQFAASTQLTNGTYVVEVEDPRGRFLFDRVQITINGTVLPALQVIAKSKRSLEREQLEKQIFGTPNAST